MKWLSGWLGQKSQERTTEASAVKMLPLDYSLEPFGIATFATVLNASGLIADKWSECTGAAQSGSANWIVRSHELAYVLHIVNRFTFAVGGDALRSRLQDYYAPRLVNSLVESSWQPASAQKANDPSFLTRMFNETLANVDTCEMKYEEFPEFLSKPQVIERVDGNGVHLVPPEDDIAFGLSAMIAEDTSVEVTPSLQEMIWGSNTTALSSSGFISHLTTTIDLAKRSS